MKCKHCNRKINPIAKNKSPGGLPPTGGDYEFIDYWEDLKCKHCGHNLEANFRYWLDNGRIECINIKLRAADPDPWCSAWKLSFSPDGNLLVIQSKNDNVWMLAFVNGNWQIKFKNCLFPDAWHPDSTHFFDKSGKIVNVSDGKIIESIEYPMIKYRKAKLHKDNYLILEWETILKEYSGISIYSFKTKKWQEYPLPYTKGVSMSGKVWFEANGDRLLRVYPAFHGSDNYIVELFQIQPEKPEPVKLLATFNEDWLDIEHIWWDEDDSILIGYTHYDICTMDCDSMPFGILRVNGKTLKEINRQHILPEEPCTITTDNSEFNMQQFARYDGLYFLSTNNRNILIVTDALYLLNESKGNYKYTGRLAENIFLKTNREFHERYITTYSLEKKLLAVSFRNELYLYDIVNKQIVALGSKLI